jgi:zinc/manganese transport system permease protein
MSDLLLHIEILLPAFLAGILILMTHVPLGEQVLKRGIIFLDLAVAHIAATSVVATNIIWPHGVAPVFKTLIAICSATLGAMALYYIRGVQVRIQESIIGISFILAATGSILLLSTDPHGGERLQQSLVGQILWLGPKDLITLAIIYSCTLSVWIKLKDTVGDWLFYPVFAITITLSTQIVGVYLVFASLIIPVLCTLHHPNPKRHAFIIGLLGYFIGLLMSSLYDVPAGASIVWCLALLCGLYFVISSSRLKKLKGFST